MKKKIKCCTAFGIILGFLALAATVIAFATDHWIDIVAKGNSRTSVMHGPWYPMPPTLILKSDTALEGDGPDNDG